MRSQLRLLVSSGLLFLASSLNEAAASDVYIVDVSATGTYFTNPGSFATDAAVIRLADVDAAPGDSLRIEMVGSMQFGSDLPATGEGLLTGAFSASSTLRSATEPNRIVDLIPGGCEYDTSWVGIPNFVGDFLISQVFRAQRLGTEREQRPRRVHHPHDRRGHRQRRRGRRV